MTDFEEIFNISYWRTLESSINRVLFVDAFYDRFLASSPEVANLFANTEFRRQKNMFLISLVHMASFNPVIGPDDIIKQLADRHRDLGIRPELFQLWLEALLTTVAEYDPDYDDQVGEAWRRVLTPGIDYMISTLT